MSTIINGYYISYTIGDDFAEVRKIGYVDEFNRLIYMELVFRGTWSECKKFAESQE